MATKQTDVGQPAEVFPPGDLLREELAERRINQADFAAIVDRPVQAVNEILAGKKAITPEMAHLIAEALGTSPEFWMNLESRYRLWRARKTAVEDVSRRARLYEKAPVKELLRRRWLTGGNDLTRLEDAVCRLLEIPSLEEDPVWRPYLRRSLSRPANEAALLCWVARGRQLARKAKAGRFSAQKLEAAVPNLVELSAAGNETQLLQVLLDLGVRSVLVPHLTGTHVDGAATWLSPTEPVVLLSLRYKRVDNFWFTLLHELAHLLRHKDHGEASFVDEWLGDVSPEGDDHSQALEREANELANSWLIPADRLSSWFRSRHHYSKADIESFASELGVHPGIVVGRLHYLRKLPYTHLRRMLEPVKVQPTS